MRRAVPYALAFCVGLACAPTIDLPGGESSTSETSAADESSTEESTSETTTAGFIDTGDGDGDGDGTEPPPTCGDMLDCVFEECVVAGFDLQCVAGCGMGADPSEVAEAGALLACIGGRCFDQGECSLTDLVSESCIGCIGFGLFLPEPPGCVDEALACAA